MDNYEQWTLAEIQRLRADADALQLSYDRFIASQGRKPKTSNGSAEPIENQSRKSKYGPLHAAWAEASRDHPIKLDDMHRIAAEAGFKMARSNLRSNLFAAKKLGRVEVVGDGYRWKPSKEETALSDQESAAVGLFE